MATAHITPQAPEIQQQGLELYQQTLLAIGERYMDITVRHGANLANKWRSTPEGKQLYQTAIRLRRVFPRSGGGA